MNSKIENAIHATFVTSALIISLFIAGAAFAGTPDDDVRSETVKFRDLDLQSDTGVSALYQRIQAAARRVCDQPSDAGVSSAYAVRSCKEKAESRAVMSVNVPSLTAYYQKVSGHPIPMLANDK